MKHNETDLLHLFIERAPFVLPRVRVFRRNIVNTISVHGFHARNGIAGQADAYALVQGGRHIEIETKAATRLRKAQEAWRDFCDGWGVKYLVLRAQKSESAHDTVERWCGELAEVVR